MHLKSCCALFLLALVACQAAPATEEKPIAENDPKDLNIEEAGADKDRSKKSTTLCVEFSSGREQQVPCNQAQQPAVLVQEQPNKLVYLSQPQQHSQSQTIVVPTPQQIVQPTPQTHFIHVQEKQQQQQNLVLPGSQQAIQLQPSYSTVQIVQPQPTIQVAPQPTVQVQTRPTVQVQQPQQTVQVQSQPSVQVQSQPSVQVQSQPSVQVQPQPTVQVQTRPTVQVQSQPTVQVQTRPTVQVLQPQPVPQQTTHVFQVQTQPQPQQQQNTVVVPSAQQTKTQVVVPNYKVESSAPCASEVVIQPQVELITPQVVPQVIQQQPTIIEVPYSVETQSEDDLYECSCHPGKQSSKAKVGRLTDVLTVYPGSSVVASTPFVSGGQLVSGNSLLSSGHYVSGGQFVADSPLLSDGQQLVASGQFARPLVSGSASIGPFSRGTLASIAGSTPIGSVASTASLGSVAGTASLGPISADASLGLLHGSASLKSPLGEYNLNTGVRPASLGEGLEARRHKHNKVPAQLSIQVPVSTVPVAPSVPAAQYYSSIPNSDTQYYTSNSYYPSTAQISYPYYGTTYSYAYPNSYPTPTSATSATSASAITLNASGPFYRESQHTDNTQEMSTTDKPQKETSSPTVPNAEVTSINQKREATQEQKDKQIAPSAIQT